ncbi:hypothetical protein PGTUg99_007380 [Puccinia graminis f. sp. tritici]|uniref:Uncharacterized protein n=1 Tax=Puccinia graminis f. sp. tritici TaxID=56615 RepID=A0A5B0RHF5_PUCGR|nr:hypothetical protein PGTUg99_007380 [Puccinia graminis f. sp. tritici]
MASPQSARPIIPSKSLLEPCLPVFFCLLNTRDGNALASEACPSLHAAAEEAIRYPTDKPMMQTNLEKKIWRSYKQTFERLSDWRRAVMRRAARQPQQMGAARRLRKARQRKKKMVDAARGLANLFEKRIYELRGAPFLFKTGEGHRQVSAEVSRSIIESWEGMWLRSIAQLDEIWNGLMDIEECFKDLGLMGYGSDLIILFFNIFHTYQIVTHNRLAYFLNEENRGRLIFSYSISRFSSTRWHLSLRDTYRNFNLRLSLQESRLTKNLAGLLKLLDWDTWGSIEFDYLATELSLTTYDRSLPQDLRAMKATFLDFAGSPSQAKLSVAELEGLLRRLVTYISEELPHQMLGSHSSDFIEFKLLYDMLSFIVRYHTHILSE